MVKHNDHTENTYNDLWDVYFGNEDSGKLIGSKGRSRANRKSTHYKASRIVLGSYRINMIGMPDLVPVVSLD